MISYDNNSIRTFFMLKGSVIPRCSRLSAFTGLMGFGWAMCRSFEVWSEDLWVEENRGSPRFMFARSPFAIRTLCISVLGFLLTTRANMALNRWMEGLSGIQAMLSFWTDAFNQINAFMAGKVIKDEKEADEQMHFRCRIAHWFSIMSCLALVRLRNKGEDTADLNSVPMKPRFPPGQMKRSMSGRNVDVKWNAPDDVTSLELTIFHAPSRAEVAGLEDCSDKVLLLSYWILQSVMVAVREGMMDAPAPIVTRIHAEMLLGIQAYQQALKIAQVQFPFPFSQITAILLVLMYLCLPLFMDTFTSNFVLTPIVSFLIPLCFCGLNNVSIELEEPYGTDYNDVDVEERHEAFVQLMQDVLTLPMMPPISKTGEMERNLYEGYKKKVGAQEIGQDYTTGGYVPGWEPQAPPTGAV